MSQTFNQKKQVKAVMLILGSAFFFSLMNLFVRLAGPIPTMQKALFRNLISALVAAGIAVRSHTKIKLNAKQGGCLFIRALMGTIGLLCNFYAVDHMNVSDATMLNKLSPFFVVLLSAPILKERLRGRDFLYVLLAFCGAMFVAKPTFQSDMLPSLIGILGGLTAGCAYVYVRKLSQLQVPNALIVLGFSVFSCLFILPFVVASYVPMTTQQVIYLLLCGVSAAAAQFCITAAYSNAPGRDIAVYDYSQIVFTALLSFFVLGQVPDVYSIIGYVLVIGAAVWKHFSPKP